MTAALKWLLEAIELLFSLSAFLILLFFFVMFIVLAAKKIKEVWKNDRDE